MQEGVNLWGREDRPPQSPDASFWSLDHIQGTYTPEIYCPNGTCKSLFLAFLPRLLMCAPLGLKGDQGMADRRGMGRTWMWLGVSTHSVMWVGARNGKRSGGKGLGPALPRVQYSGCVSRYSKEPKISECEMTSRSLRKY